MTDLTKITTPFGLLDAETQGALKAHGGPWEFATPEGDWRWRDVDGRPVWSRLNVYRVKPSPSKPREWWIAPNRTAVYKNLKDLTFEWGSDAVASAIHVIEVRK